MKDYTLLFPPPPDHLNRQEARLHSLQQVRLIGRIIARQAVDESHLVEWLALNPHVTRRLYGEWMNLGDIFISRASQPNGGWKATPAVAANILNIYIRDLVKAGKRAFENVPGDCNDLEG